ncbi:hypothetical protein BGZ90_012141, partial [Linnemannia elongata]
MRKPQYQELFVGLIPRAMLQDGVALKVIAGVSHGVKFQFYPRTSTMFLDFMIDKTLTVAHTILAKYSGFMYVLSGKANIGGDRSESTSYPPLLQG